MNYEERDKVIADRNAPTEVDEKMYWKMVKFARQAIYGDQSEQILSVISNSPDSAKGLGGMVADIVGALLRDGTEKGARFNRPTVRKVFEALISDIAEYANAKGVISFESQEQVDRFVNECLLHAVESYARQVKRRQGDAQPEQPQQPQQPPQQGLLQQ